MEEIKFYCPECSQKIGVRASDAGRQMDCPICHSTLSIPPGSGLPVEMIEARKSAQMGDPQRKPNLQRTMRLIPHVSPKRYEQKGFTSAVVSESSPLQSGSAEVLRLKADLKNSAAQLNEVLSESAQLASRHADAVQEIGRLKTQAAEAAGKKGVLENECGRLKTQLAALTIVCENQRVNAGSAEGNLQSLREELEAALMQIQNLRRQLREVGDYFANSERERIQLLLQLQQSAQLGQRNAANEAGDVRTRPAASGG